MDNPSPTRRAMLKTAAGGLLALLGGCATSAHKPAVPRVIVIGGGFGGATAARYLRLWSGGSIDVTLVEPNRWFVSCPMSNLVLGGTKTLADITCGYDGQRELGVTVVHDTARAIDAEHRVVHLASGTRLPCDRLVVSPASSSCSSASRA